MMIILVALTTIEGLQQTHGDAKGFEFDYFISNTGDAADYTVNYPMHKDMAWPDTSIAHEWIRYFICARNPFHPTQYDKHQPGYLAIVHPEITNNMSSDSNIDRLLKILQSKYGDSNTYLNEFYTDSLNESTWFSQTYKSTDIGDNINGDPTPLPTPPPTEFSYRYCWEHSNVTSYINLTEGMIHLVL